MAHLDPGAEQGLLKGEAAPDEKAHKVRLPKGGYVTLLLAEDAAAVDAVGGKVGGDVAV